MSVANKIRAVTFCYNHKYRASQIDGIHHRLNQFNARVLTYAIRARTALNIHAHKFEIWRKPMQKFSLLFIVAISTLFFLLPTQAPAQAHSNFGTLLVELETCVKWDAQTDAWKSQRTAWIEKVHAATTVSEMKPLLVDFEKNIFYKSQVETWKASRPAWLERVKACETEPALAQCLLDVEVSILFDSQPEEWRQKRDAWIAKVQQLQEQGQEAE